MLTKGVNKMNRLKELRKEKGLTQKDLSDEMGVSKRTYIYWENGESQIKPDKAQALADFFGVSVGYLLGYEDDSEKDLTETFNNYRDELNNPLSLEDYNNLSKKLNFLIGKQLIGLHSKSEFQEVEKRIFFETINNLKDNLPKLENEQDWNYLLNSQGFEAIKKFYLALNYLPEEERDLIVNFVTIEEKNKKNISELVESLSLAQTEIKTKKSP